MVADFWFGMGFLAGEITMAAFIIFMLWVYRDR